MNDKNPEKDYVSQFHTYPDPTNLVYHIPLGLDCTIAHQLKKRNLRFAALPFDWMKITIDSLLDVLDNQFFNFLNKERWSIIEQSANFNYVDDIDMVDTNSLLKLKHKDYKIILPHEAKNDIIDLDEIMDKYKRRIDRFNEIIKSNKCKIIYVGIDKINDLDKQKIIKCLDDYGCINYKIKFIEYLNYPLIGDYSWHRNWIPWNILYN